VSFSKTGRTLEYRGQKFQKDKSGYKWNHFDVENGDHYWISGPRKDGQDRLYAQSTQPIEIDDDIREEYWATIRGIAESRGSQALGHCPGIFFEMAAALIGTVRPRRHLS
jgi:hypothetical protein